jgi:ATP synthase protein I
MNDPTRPGQRPSPVGGGSSLSGLAGVGIQFAVTIIVFLFAGQWLDRHFGTTPWLLILGVLIGASAGFYSLYRKLMAAQAHEEARRK